MGHSWSKWDGNSSSLRYAAMEGDVVKCCIVLSERVGRHLRHGPGSGISTIRIQGQLFSIFPRRRLLN
jgi:hypothetical protein